MGSMETERGRADYKKTKQERGERRAQRRERCEKDASVGRMHITSEACLGDAKRSHVPLLLSPLVDHAPLRLYWEKGNGRRIYCWVLTCTHSWCCFSPLGPLGHTKGL